MEQVSTTNDSGTDPGHEMNGHAAIVRAEDLPPDAQELTPDQRALLDTALRTLFAKHSLDGADAILGNPRLGYCQKILGLYGLHLWTWFPGAEALLRDAMRLLPPYLRIHIQQQADQLRVACVTCA